jgi:hypothetical protein
MEKDDQQTQRSDECTASNQAETDDPASNSAVNPDDENPAVVTTSAAARADRNDEGPYYNVKPVPVSELLYAVDSFNAIYKPGSSLIAFKLAIACFCENFFSHIFFPFDQSY